MATVVGVPNEVKEQEGRLSMQPDGVAELGDHGHEGFIQAAADEGGGFEDQGYVSCGARVVETTDGVFEAADLIVKVKEPVPEEYDRFHEGQELFTYLHLAADKELTEYLMDRKVNSIAYETVELPEGSLPLLAPMSEVAGRMAVQAAAQHLESPQGGAGLLLGGNLVSEPVAEAHGLPHTSQEQILG
jgi:alanine dehydrogenase